MPLVSVIVPNYNHARFLRQRIDSILAQTYQDFELILLDDCSTDDSRRVLQEYAGDPRVRLEFNERNSGSPFAQWNKGVRLARGKYVWIAESDDYADQRLLERLVRLLDADSEVVIAYCRSWGVCLDGKPFGFADGYVYFWDPEGWKADFCMDGRRMCQEYFCGCNRIPNASGVVFRRAIYERVGGADGSNRLCGDWKVWAAMALEGKVAYVSEPLNYFRHHGSSVRERTRMANAALEMLVVGRWILDRIPTPSPRVARMMHRVHANAWVRSMASPRVPLKTKKEIMRLVRAIDPHPVLTAARFLPTWFAFTLRHRFSKVWYPFLEFTYKFRHTVGLTRNGLAQIKVRFGR